MLQAVRGLLQKLQEKGIISVQALRQWLGEIAGIAPTSV